MDAFADGQVSSKLWLCEKLEEAVSKHFLGPISLRVYGSWQGLLPFMILSRNQFPVKRFDLYDIESSVHDIARKVLDHWHFQNKVSINYYTQDCNQIPLSHPVADVIINTSCEHIRDLTWWKEISSNTLYCLQTTDMPHPTHVNGVTSLQQWKDQLNLSQPSLYEGERFTEYSTFSFHRWMLIGFKNGN